MGTELFKAPGRNRSVGWTPSILWGPRSGVKRRRHLRLGFESGVGVHWQEGRRGGQPAVGVVHAGRPEASSEVGSRQLETRGMIRAQESNGSVFEF